jgi:hypothetical protein
MLFRLEQVPFHHGAKPLQVNPRWIEALAVLPEAVDPDGSVRNSLLCWTDAGLQRLDEREVWEALHSGQYREARRSRVG